MLQPYSHTAFNWDRLNMADSETRIGLTHTGLIGLLIVFLTSTLTRVHALNTYILTDYCDESFSFRHHGVDAFLLRSTHNDTYAPNTDCTMKIFAPIGYRILFIFQYIDVPDNCRDYASVYQFEIDQYHSLDPEICRLPTRKPLATDDIHASISFLSDSQGEGRGFQVIVTSFRVGGADCLQEEGELLCDNSRCINSSFMCNGFDHCGDDSNNKDCDGLGITVLKILAVFAFICFAAFLLHLGRRGITERGCIDCTCCKDILSGVLRCQCLPTPRICCKRSRPSTSSRVSQPGSNVDTVIQSVPPSPVLPTPLRHETTPTPESPPLIWTNTSLNGESTFHDPPPSYEQILPQAPPPRYEDVVRT